MTKAIPIAYLITFTCYGTHLHGHDSGSVDKAHPAFGFPFALPNPKRVRANREQLRSPAYTMQKRSREIVLAALQRHCVLRGWTLRAAHVRSAHVHLVVTAEEMPERILADVKAYASRALNESKLEASTQKRWTAHGSTRYLWKPEHLGAAIHYVVSEQGEPMAVWRQPD